MCAASRRWAAIERRKCWNRGKQTCTQSPRSSGGGKRDPELRAGLAVSHLDAPAHRRRELPNEREPDARSDRLARELVLGSIEEIEDLLHLPFRDSGAEISHGE